MNREYHKWYSSSLNREMELLVFGYSGKPVLIFPTRCGRFYDYENWKVLDGVRNKIENGDLQVYCVDSIDKESFYCSMCKPEDKIRRHVEYENYLLYEVLPLIHFKRPWVPLIAAGCSMGAFHAVNLAFKYPWVFDKVLGMSGRYDLSFAAGSFKDLFEGYWNEDIYFNMPSQYIGNLEDNRILNELRNMEIVLAVGREDSFLENNIKLSNELGQKSIHHSLYLWEGEAHKPWFWKNMLQLYL